MNPVRDYIILTGGSGGLGQALIQAFKPLCHQLIVIYNTHPIPAEAQIWPVKLDLTENPSHWDKVLEPLIEIFKNNHNRLWGIILNAGIFKSDESYENWLHHWQIHVAANHFLCEKLWPWIQKAGQAWQQQHRSQKPPAQSDANPSPFIVGISSSIVLEAQTHHVGYAASKAGFNYWIRSWALKCASSNVRVFGVLPGIIDTPIHPQQGPEREKWLQSWKNQIPLGFICQPFQVAEFIKALVIHGEALTGQLVVFDGGLSLKSGLCGGEAG